ncbi:RE1-silencing transcription factor [Aulostomus maculatus]
MATQTFSVEMFPVGVSLMEDSQNLSDMPRNMPAPQLVMLANVAAVTAAEGGGCDGSVADEKEMMELKTVGCSYSDSEDESIIRYSYDNQNHREVCIIEYPESPGPNIHAVVVGNDGKDDEGDRDKAEDLSKHSNSRTTSCNRTPPLCAKRKDVPVTVATTEGGRKKKPFHCKPCHFQAQHEQEFVDHLSTHAVSKMMVVNRVEGRSKAKAKEVETKVSPDGKGESSGGATGALAAADSKGLIRCERCGYNTNRYDHYIAHLKHHSKEGEDHRVFKCTLCPYTTISQYHWRKHLRNHFPSKLHTCSQCSYFSDRKSNYIQHIRTHTGVRPFQCPYCDYSSAQKTHLTRHMRTHSGERPFKCESCNYLAANQHEVTRHIRQVHNGPKPLACPYCEYKTADRSNFKKHVELHLHPRQFLCPLCKYAASKKCNLQYHIKSRHSGCDVTVDVSKVKLRVKKPGVEETTKARKLGNSSSVDEDLDGDEELCHNDKQSGPINLSVRKSSKLSSGQLTTGESPDDMQKKSSTSEKEKSSKMKDKAEPEKKVTTRQKRAENCTKMADFQKETRTTDNKSRRRVKRLLTVQEPADHEAMEAETSNHQGGKEDRAVEHMVGKEKGKAGPEEREQLKSSEKENKGPNKPRMSKKSATSHKHGGPNGLPKETVAKEKATKRKAAEALDLSPKSPSETLSKVRRRKASKTASEETDKTKAAASTPPTGLPSLPGKQKLTRKSNRKPAELEQAAASAESGSIDSLSSKTPGRDTPTQQSVRPARNSTCLHQTPPPEPNDPFETEASPGETLDEPSNKKMGVSLSCRSSSPAKDCPAPMFVEPTSRTKPTEAEDDEGIHSSHEGGSDISDSGSEGSDDSGLNSNGASSGKMANDPETPTDEIPTPTELKSHTCIFCDRTFPIEVEYRRHLNRHLVNVYYMDTTSKGE